MPNKIITKQPINFVLSIKHYNIAISSASCKPLRIMNILFHQIIRLCNIRWRRKEEECSISAPAAPCLRSSELDWKKFWPRVRLFTATFSVMDCDGPQRTPEDTWHTALWVHCRSLAVQKRALWYLIIPFDLSVVVPFQSSRWTLLE